MKIAIGCDPNAAELKQELKAFISGLGHECVDFGGDDPIYANTAVRLAKAVAAGECDRGVLICGTGTQVTGAELAKCLVAAYLKEEFDPQSRSAPKVRRICEYENGID